MKRFFITFFCLLTLAGLQAQTEGIGINTTGADPDASAILDVQSTDKGMLVPRVSSAQRLAIPSPATSLLVFDTDENGFWFYNGSAWQALNSASTDNQSLAVDWDSLSITNGVGVALDTLEHRLFSDRLPGGSVADVIQDQGGNYINLLSTGWQSWTATQNGLLSEIQYNVNAALPFDGGYASIYVGEGVNAGSLLQTIQIQSNTGGWDVISFDGLKIELEAGQKYTVQITDSVDVFAWDIAGSDIYAGGRPDQATSAEYAFRVFVKPFLIRSLINVDTVIAGAFIGDGSGLTNLSDSDNQSLDLREDSLFITNGSGVAIVELKDKLFKNNNYVTDASQEASTGAISNFGSTWQSWTSTRTAYLEEIHCLFVNNSFDGGTASIYKGEGINAANLIQQIQIGAHTTGWDTLSFQGLNLELEQNQKYTISIIESGGAFAWWSSNSDPYPGGRASVSATTDYTFRVLVNDSYAFIQSDTIVASAFIGDGSGLTNLPIADNQSLGLSLDSLTIDNGTGVALEDLESNLFKGEIPVADIVQETSTFEIGGTTQWQSWTATQDGILSKFQFEVPPVHLFNGGYALLYLGQGFMPANLLATIPIESQPAGWNTISFEGLNIELDAAQTYSLSITDTANNFSWRVNPNDPYAGGFANGYPVYDMAFRVFTREKHPASIFLDSVVASVFIGDGSGLINVPDNDNQTLALSNSDLSISGGNTIDISSIDTDNQTLSLSGSNLSISGGNTANLSSIKDNLGDHTATTNIELNGNWLSNDGGNEGIYVNASGEVGIGTDNPQAELDLRGSLSINDLNPNIEFLETQFGITRRSVIHNVLNTVPGGAAENIMEFWVSNGVGQNTVEVLKLYGDNTTETQGDLVVKSNADIDGNLVVKSNAAVDGQLVVADDASINGDLVVQGQVIGDLEVSGSVKMNNNIVYSENWNTYPNINNGVWQTVTPYTQWMTVENGNVLKAHFNLAVRLEGGSGTDDFIFKVLMESNGSGCPTDSSEELFYRPDEYGINHDNFVPISYMDMIPINCNGLLRFRVLAINTGDDQFEVRDRSLSVTKY